MASNGTDLITLSEYLQHTLSPDVHVRKPAEKFLESIEGNQNYPALLLQLIEKPDVILTLKIAGAVAFKNYIKRNWKVEEDGVDRIHSQDRAVIKKLIVDLMLHSPESIQKQLSDAVAIVGRYDFPSKWPDLIDQMVEKFNSGDFHVINGVLHTAHSLFKRYRFESKSQTLWEEIKFVLDKFAKPLTELFLVTMNLTVEHANNAEALNVIYNSLTILSKVFYSLNYQDLPEFFEDNMEVWMSNFHRLLTVNVPLLQSNDTDEPGIIEQLRTQICDNIVLYAQKYDEEFQKYVPQFLEAIWKLLNEIGQETKYDALVSKALQFLVTVADRDQYRSLFEEPATLHNICTNLITPNIEFRQSDCELFEDNSDEYIRRDIEGSDVDTRRRAACDLVKILAKQFGTKVMDIFGTYVMQRLEEYTAKPAENWRKKDAVIYLVTSSAVKGQTQRHGVTQSHEFVPIPQFAVQHIQPELAKSNINEFPVLKADAIRFIMSFRTILPREIVMESFPHLIRHLAASSVVVHSYAACAIEKILANKGPDNLPQVKSSDIESLSAALLNGLFAVLDMPGSEENEYAMKAIMRSFCTLDHNVVPYLGNLLPKLTEKLAIIAQNPSRPNFNHYLFETLCLSIRIVCKTNSEAVGSFESVLFPIFQTILEKDVQEFIPYVFQILAFLLELHPVTNVPDAYMALFPCLLSPILFERQGNIHPLTRLLQAFVSHGSHQIIAEDKTSALLGVFQKLIASKANDHEGFNLIQKIIQYFPPNVLEPYMKQVFVLLFQRLSSSKTFKFVKNFIVFIAYYAIRYGAPNLITIIDEIQPHMFSMVLDRVVIVDLQTVSGEVERKITAVGISKLLIECPTLLEAPYNVYYPKVLAAIIEFFEMPQDRTGETENLFIPDVDDGLGYQAAYNQLICARNPPADPLGDIGDVRVHLARGLGRFPSEQINGLMRQIPETNANYLKNYLQMAGVNCV